MLLKGSLDDRFFVMADRMPEGNCDPSDDTATSSVLEYYECVFAHSTMVMYSQRTGAPLAALALAASDEMMDCQSMITRRAPPPKATEAYFQGMLNIEGSFFEFSISNLSNEGAINFNILRVSGDAPNPGSSYYGINEVNELGPNKSYTVKADQQNKRRMCLRGKKRPSQDANSSSRLEPVSVKEAESGSPFQEGLYFYLSVVPEASCSALVELFSEGTVWKVADEFVRKVNQPKPWNPRRLSLSQPRTAPRISASESSSSGSSEFSVSSRQRRSKCPLELASMKSMSELERTYGIDSVADQKCPFNSVSMKSMALERVQGIDSVTVQNCPFELVTMKRMGELKPLHGIDSVTVQKPNWKSMPDVETLYDSPSRSGCTSASLKNLDDIDGIFASQSRMKRGSRGTQIRDISSTQATDLGYGEEIQVNSVRSRRKFDFDKASAPTVLCMSIWKEMSFFPVDISDSLGSRRGVRAPSHYYDHQRRLRLDSVGNLEEDDDWEYELETCLIDFASPIDTILVPCGHRCFNSANLDPTITKCPLCRTPISAVLPVGAMS